MTALDLPAGYSRIQIVHSFQELISTPFQNGVNAICWQRTLPGDFNEVVQLLTTTSAGITTLDEPLLRSLPASEAGKVAIEIMLEDFKLLTEHGLDPVLDCIHGYPREEEPGAIRTDVYSFHADSATAEADTYLCTYSGASSQGLRNDEAQRYVDLPETRAALLKEYGGQDDADFAEHLHDYCYDLHYAPAPQAQPFSFGVGNLWRIAVDYAGSPVPPCIHRAPETPLDAPPRLLLIS
jgi:hypothetical protein